MPTGTPFHSRTAAACISQNWRTWSGYFVASSYDVVHDYEYHAIRSTAALIDVSPLYKYDVRGTDAARLINRVITRDAAKCAIGQALYTCICNSEGKVIQDGTVFRFAEDYYRCHLADPALRWLKLNATGMDVDIQDVSEQIAALAVQGPYALEVLQAAADVNLADLRFFRLKGAKLRGIPVVVSRTGYTGDLGYEIWLAAQDAEQIWDTVVAAGKPFGIKPAGMLALDIARLEAGFILLEVDYIGAEKALIPSQRYSPYEIGLSWTVDLKKDHFVGSRAIRKEDEDGLRRQIIGLEIDLNEFERLFQQIGLPPQVPTTAWRGSAGVFSDGKQVGYATTGGWSPVLKKYIAIATLERDYVKAAKRLAMDVTVEHQLKKVGVTVAKLPFYDPPRKRQLFNT